MALDIEKLKKEGTYDEDFAIKKFSRQLTTYEIACALTHLNIYRRLVDENIEMAIVSEDDVHLVPNFREELARVLAELPHDWELVYFWYRTKETKTVSKRVVSFPFQNQIP